MSWKAHVFLALPATLCTTTWVALPMHKSDSVSSEVPTALRIKFQDPSWFLHTQLQDSPRNKLWLPMFFIMLHIYREASTFSKSQLRLSLPGKSLATQSQHWNNQSSGSTVCFLITAITAFSYSGVFYFSPRMCVPLGLATMHVTHLYLSQCLVASRCSRKRFRSWESDLGGGL